MTLTPAPFNGWYASCEACKTTIIVADDHPVPFGWIEVRVEGYVGSFLACSEDCAEKVRMRKKKQLEKER